MRQFLNCILIGTCLFFYNKILHAQTLNADTLAKYRVSKILTYKIDSTGQKDLYKIQIINNQGLIFDSCTYEKNYIESTLCSIFIDSVKYEYNENGKLIFYTNIRNVSSYSQGTEKSNHYLFKNIYHYKRPFFISPFQKNTHFYVYDRKGKEIIKRYSMGKRGGYFTYATENGCKYSFEKYYKIKYKNKFKKKVNGLYFWGKPHTIQKTSMLNSNGDIIKENVLLKHDWGNIFNKPIDYSYIKTYKYIYKDSLIISCSTIQPDFTYTSKNEKVRKKRIRYVEERGILEETTFYEYITTP